MHKHMSNRRHRKGQANPVIKVAWTLPPHSAKLNVRMRTNLVAVALAAALAGCGEQADVQCTQSADCDLTGGGVCIAATNGHQWCAYPDPACDSGYRYSNQSVGDGLADTCTTPGTGPTTHTLSVHIGGSGAGTVAADVNGLQCSGSTCTGKFAEGTSVQLSATPTTGIFLGWSGDCSGSDTCVVTMDADHSATALFGLPGEGLWSQQLGGTGEDFGLSIAIDSQGNVITVGRFSASITIGTTTITSAGSFDLYVAKFDGSNGNLIWLKNYGGANAEQPASVALDASDNIYVTGTFSGSADFGGGTLTSAGGDDVFALKLTSAGAFAWAKRFGGTNVDSAGGIAVRGSKAYVAANFLGSVTVGTTTLTSAGSFDIMLVASDLDGNIAYAKQYGGTGTDVSAAVAVDSTDNVVIAGRFNGTSNFGGGALTSAGNFDALLLKVAGADGSHLVSKRFGSTAFDAANGVGIGASNSILLLGSFNGSVDFGTGALTASQTTTSDVFLAKFSAAGACQWSKGFGGTGTTQGRSGNALAVNSTGDVAITGAFDGTVSFGGSTLSSAGSTDVFAARFSGIDGAHLNSVRAGGADTEYANGIAQATDGRFFVSGTFNGFADFGGQALTSKGGNDGFVLALAPL